MPGLHREPRADSTTSKFSFRLRRDVPRRSPCSVMKIVPSTLRLT